MQEEEHYTICELCRGCMCVCVSSIIWTKLPYAWEKVLFVLSLNHTGEMQEDEGSKSPTFIGNWQYHLMTSWKS